VSAGALRGARVVLVFDSLELGGAERQGLLLAHHLAREDGATVQVWGFDRPGVLTAHCDALDIPWRVVPAPWPAGRAGKARTLLRLAWALRRAHADAILSYTMRPNVLCGLVWPLTGARCCVWNQRDAGVQRLGERIERRALARVPIVVSNSAPGRDFLARELGVPAGRVAVVPNGVEAAHPLEDRASWRRRLGLAESDFVACMVANFHALKDHRTLIRAWRHVVDHAPEIGARPVLLLAGHAWESTAPLTALVRELGLEDTVRFIGQVIDVAGLLEACDLAVLSSRCEGAPNAVLEAMAAGRPVAGTDNPGIRGVVGRAGAAHLAPPGDAEALAARIVELARDAALRARVGEANRRRAAAEFAPERMCRDMVAIVRRGLDRAAVRA
jgi:glycosyltransferase involved in cell wall biosynthesis